MTPLTKIMNKVFARKFFAKHGGPLNVTWQKGGGRFVLVLGDNASGKSIFRRLIVSESRAAGFEAMDLSMERRVGGGVSNAFIYGSEQYDSTGQISVRSVVTGINTCKTREHEHIIYWDEPDLGLSDSYAAGMGQMLREFAFELPEKTLGVFITTHSRSLVAQLLGHGCMDFVLFGDYPDALSWMSDTNVKDPRELGKKAKDLFRELHKYEKRTA